jgi:hypothetical protein
MEHLDSLAGSIAYKHILGPTSKILNVEEMGLYLHFACQSRFKVKDLQGFISSLLASSDSRW